MTLPGYDASEGRIEVTPSGKVLQVWDLPNGRATRDPAHAARVCEVWWINEGDRLLNVQTVRRRKDAA
jgi:hypothetical protein